ncbi:MAG: T9SS type A sorting domain-containing protein [Saprospiraceae bacterium]
MKTKIKVSIFMLLLNAALHAQAVFPDAGAEWVVNSNNPLLGANDYYNTWKYWLEGDTTINGMDYVKVYLKTLCFSTTDQNHYLPANPSVTVLAGAVRIMGQQVYFLRFPGQGSLGFYAQEWAKFPVGQESLLYDFSLAVSDTVEYATGKNLVVTDTSTDSQGRKVIDLQYLGDPPFASRWVEGLGCTKGLLETTFYWFDFGCCINTEQWPEDCTLPCAVTYSTEAIRSAHVAIFPSPASTYVTIHPDFSEQPFDVDLYNYMGAKIACYQNITTESKIPIEDLGPGMLLFAVKTKEGKMAVAKVMKD